MKRFALLSSIFITLCITLTSCKKDLEKRLPGDWDLAYDGGYYDPSGTVLAAGITQNGTMTFNEDGTYEIKIPSYTTSGTWSSDDESVTLISEGESIIFKIEANNKTYVNLVSRESVTFEDQNATLKIDIELRRD